MRILGIAGYPGTGKSTLVKQIIYELGSLRFRKKHGTLEYEHMKDVNILGYYEENNLFGGTDRLSMSVQQDAVDFLNKYVCLGGGETPIIWEGDRLSNSEFIKLCNHIGEFRFIVLKCDEVILTNRRNERSLKAGKVQNETWVKGRESKVYNLQQMFDAEVRKVNSPEDSRALANELKDWILGLAEIPERESSLLF